MNLLYLKEANIGSLGGESMESVSDADFSEIAEVLSSIVIAEGIIEYKPGLLVSWIAIRNFEERGS